MNPTHPSQISGLFESNRRRRFLIDHAIEGHAGTAIADDLRNPCVAQITVGQVTVFGGPCDLPASRRMIEGLARTIATPETEQWQDLLLEVHGGKIERRTRVNFSSERLDRRHLENLKKNHTKEFRVERIDEVFARLLDNEVGGGFFGKFRSIEQFLEIGVGFCGVVDDRVVCGAVSGVTCKRGIGIQIQTHPDHLRRSFGTSVGATLILHCLENGMEPNWSAATAISSNMAEKLGYVKSSSYDELIVLDD